MVDENIVESLDKINSMTINLSLKPMLNTLYETIDHIVLSEQIHQHTEIIILKRYIWQIIRRNVEYGGNFQAILTYRVLVIAICHLK